MLLTKITARVFIPYDIKTTTIITSNNKMTKQRINPHTIDIVLKFVLMSILEANEANSFCLQYVLLGKNADTVNF